MHYREITGKSVSEDSQTVRERIRRARALQQMRFPAHATSLNARMNDNQIKIHCMLDEDSRKLIEMAVDKLGLSVRAYTRILKVARTIADLEGAAGICAPHVAEAIQYRNLDRRMI